MTSLSKTYHLLLKQFPISTQAVQTGILMASGDSIAQIFVQKKPLEKYDYFRTAQFASLGFFMAGPALTVWYRFLARSFGESRKASVTLKKVACDQLLFAPSFVAVFLTTLGVVQGRSLEQTTREIKRDYPDIMMMNYKLWPAVQLVNFYVTPLQYQVLLVQCVALFWNTYISWKTQTEHIPA